MNTQFVSTNGHANGYASAEAAWTEETQRSPINMGLTERYAFLVGGASLIGLGLFKRGPALAALPLGVFLIAKAAVGSSPLNALLNRNSAVATNPEAVSVPHEQGVHISKAVTINRSAHELYHLLLEPGTVRRLAGTFENVTFSDADEITLNIAGQAPLKIGFDWIMDEPGQVLSWKSPVGSPIAHAGAVRFREAPGGRGAEVRVEAEYVPPAGALGVAIAKLLGVEPGDLIATMLRRFKQMVEAGEIATVEGQPSGRQSE